jgi:hypothetical protein
MLWPFGAACTIVAGSLFLIWGTSAQAWYQVIGYEDVLDTAKAASTGERVLTKGTHLLHTERGFVFILGIERIIGLYSAILLIAGNKDDIRKFGDDEKARLKNADRLEELLRVAVPWYLLMLGSLFVFVGAIIQLVLSWP